MSYLVLNDATRQKLEQERLRLVNNRQTIVTEIEAAISKELDRTLQTLNALLNETPEVETVPADEIVESVTDLLEQETEVPLRSASHSRKTGTRKATSKATEQLKSSKVFELKRKFKGSSVLDAIIQVMQQDAAKTYEIDDLIAEIYGKVDEAERPRARKSLGATLMHANLAGTIQRVGQKPSRYKLGQVAASA